MEIIKAERAGFCFGVANAVEKSFEILRSRKENTFVFSYGELIHNDHVIGRLEELGMRTDSESGGNLSADGRASGARCGGDPRTRCFP